MNIGIPRVLGVIEEVTVEDLRDAEDAIIPGLSDKIDKLHSAPCIS
jgi:hypothetical protein